MQKRDTATKRLIWDLPTRVFHWALAGSFLGAYLLAEQDELRSLHVMFGYTVAGLIAFRLLWGLIGSTHSRFRDFSYSPMEAIRYLRDLATGRARDYDGHNPAGSWAIYGLLAVAAATAATGWLHYNEIGGEALEELHEVLANAWLVLVAVHVAGVIVGSLAHRRNLVATMITGRRAAESAVPASEPSVPGRDGPRSHRHSPAVGTGFGIGGHGAGFLDLGRDHRRWSAACGRRRFGWRERVRRACGTRRRG